MTTPSFTVLLDGTLTRSSNSGRDIIFQSLGDVFENATEQYETSIKVATTTTDLAVTPPSLSNAQVVVVISTQPISVKFNSNVNTALIVNKTLVAYTGDISSLYITNESGNEAVVSVYMASL